jgi:hypothetical protein
MKTIIKKIKVYSFNELTPQAQQKAVDKVRESQNFDYIYNEAYQTVKAANKMFDIREGSNNWLEYSIRHLDDNITNLKGLRLRKYLLNNFELYKGKYYSLWSKTEKSYKHYKNGYPVLKSRYSKVMFENCCVLTGVCYDDDFLKPVYDFIKNPDKDTNFDDLINSCFCSLKSSIDSEVDYRQSFEAIEEDIEANEYEFLESGEMY